MIGTWISKMMILAMNTVASGTRFPGEHKTLPMLRWMGSIDVKYKVALEPAAAHDTLLSSILMAVSVLSSRNLTKETELTFDNRSFVPWQHSYALSDLHDTTTYFATNTSTGALSFEDIGDGNSE